VYLLCESIDGYAWILEMSFVERLLIGRGNLFGRMKKLLVRITLYFAFKPCHFDPKNDICTTILIQFSFSYSHYVSIFFLPFFLSLSLYWFWPMRRETNKVVSKGVLKWLLKYHYSSKERKQIPQKYFSIWRVTCWDHLPKPPLR